MVLLRTETNGFSFWRDRKWHEIDKFCHENGQSYYANQNAFSSGVTAHYLYEPFMSAYSDKVENVTDELVEWWSTIARVCFIDAISWIDHHFHVITFSCTMYRGRSGFTWRLPVNAIVTSQVTKCTLLSSQMTTDWKSKTKRMVTEPCDIQHMSILGCDCVQFEPRAIGRVFEYWTA